MTNTQINKVCILAAGKGSRCNIISGLHKALLPINNRPMISHIFDCIPNNFEIVIAVGYNSVQLKSYIEDVHSEKKITFVDIENYEGPGSGPGLSLLGCKKELMCPFVFMPVDTYTPGFVFQDVDSNWVGAIGKDAVSCDEGASYCMISGDKQVSKIGYHDGDYIFNGIAGVFDYEEFWEGLEDKSLIKEEHQVINGLRGLSNININIFKNFYDTGNTKSYLKVRSLLSKEIVLPKSSESIYIDNGRVVKYFSSKEKASLRVERSKILKKFVPEVSQISENMYSYEYIKAPLLSNIKSEKTLDSFLKFLSDNLHHNRYKSTKKFLKDCNSMYFEKTKSRAGEFSGQDIDRVEEINGIKVLPIKDILDKIDWDQILKKAIATDIHGDLQPENILFKDNFILIDWRESFGGSVTKGDLYYDLSKLYHALLINGSYVLDNNYSVEISEKEAFLSYSIKSNLLSLLSKLKNFCVINNYDWEHVVLLGILHYINIAPFYRDYEDGKYSKFIFLLGKLLLTKHLNNTEE